MRTCGILSPKNPPLTLNFNPKLFGKFTEHKNLRLRFPLVRLLRSLSVNTGSHSTVLEGEDEFDY